MKFKLRYTKLPTQKIKLPKFQSDYESGEFTGYHPEADMKMGITNPFVYPQMGFDPTNQPTIGSQGLGFKPMVQPSLQFNTASPVQVNQNLSRDSGVADALQSFSQGSQDPAVQNFNQRKFLRGTVKDMRKRIKEGTTDETKEQFIDYKNWVNQTAPLISAEDKQNIFKTAKGISTATDILSGISEGVNFLNNRRKIKEFDRSMRDRAFDITPSASQEFEGNYDVNSGMFQPYRIFNPNEGQFAEDGGQINNTMKIRITGTPVQQMAYGGQSNYGLDLGRKQAYADMPEGRSESISSSMSAVPREMANIEAEGGETVYGDLDGDGGLEHLKIHGKRHTQGGVPLNVPEGSFIFSDTRRMKIKDPEVLRYFGLSAKSGGYTPAEIAKRYDVNKYKAVMEDPNADQLSKDTAQLMVKNYQDKLSQLALVQEGMKGFPGGVPEVAKDAASKAMPQQAMPQARFGGYLPTYQSDVASGQVTQTKTVDPRKVTREELQKLEKEGYSRVGQSNIWEKKTTSYDRKPEIPGSPGMSGSGWEGPNEKPTKLTNDPCKLAGQLAAQGVTKEELLRVKPGVGAVFSNWDAVKDCWEKNYKPKEGSKPPTKPSCEPGYEPDPENPGQCRKANESLDRVTIDEPPSVGVMGYKCIEDGAGGKTLDTKSFASAEEAQGQGYSQDASSVMMYCQPKDKFKFLQPDKFNMAAAAMFGPNIYMPWSPDLNFRPNQLALQDWQAQTQAVQSSANTAANTLGNFQPGTAMASNLAFLQGQAADNAANAIYRTDAGNVDRFNTFSQREGDRKDFVDQFNLKNRVDLYDKGTIAKQQYDNAKRQYVNNLAQSYTNAWDNRMKLGMLNAVNNIYKVDPDTGRSNFVRGMGTESFGSGQSGQSGTGNKSFAQLKADYMAAGYSESLAEKKADQMISGNKVTYTDSDMDGYPNSSRTSANQQAVNMLGNYLAAFPPRQKKGGQIKSIAEYLRGGFVFDPREY